jgi:peptide-methionine (R)-S-oxide reductase
MPERFVMTIDRRQFLTTAGLGMAALPLFACSSAPAAAARDFPLKLSDAEWKNRLTPAAYNVLRRGGTEYPFTSPLNKEHRAGRFACAGCALPLFASETKFDSGTGWPSFYASLPGAVVAQADGSLGMRRTEILCSRCGGHLGHVFDDGPPPTGKRYCMNGVAMRFTPRA